VHHGLRAHLPLTSTGVGSSSPGKTPTGGGGNSIVGNGSVVSVGSLDSVVVVVVVDVSVGVPVVGSGTGRDDGPPGADVPAATDGTLVDDVSAVVGVEAAVRRDRAGVERSTGASSVVVVAQPSPMSDRTPDVLVSGALVTVPTDALTARSSGAPGPEETTTAVRTAAPSAALPPATVHHRRRRRRRLGGR
jgi:hypothetical protein